MSRPYGGPGFEVLEQARRTVERYGMLVPGDRVLVAVSGGPDSTCLLDVLRRLAGRLDLRLEVAHVDHGLSGESAQVAARVASEAAAAGLEVHLVRAPRLEGPNLQARARAFRYGFFESVAERIGAARIATGHTLNDRAETTLARLIHGAGTEGLAGIPPVEGRRIRPLIEVTRAGTRSYCEQLGLDYHEDPANLDERFERAAVRARVLGPIVERWGEGALRAMARSAERLLDDARALRVLSDALYERVASSRPGRVVLDREGLRDAPRALRRRLLERAVGRVRDRAGGIEAALDALDRGAPAGARFAVARGIEIVIGETEVVVERPGDTSRP